MINAMRANRVIFGMVIVFIGNSSSCKRRFLMATITHKIAFGRGSQPIDPSVRTARRLHPKSRRIAYIAENPRGEQLKDVIEMRDQLLKAKESGRP